MQQDILKNYKQTKWVQLALLIIISVICFISLFGNELFRKSIYTNKTLFMLAGLMWGILLFSFICLLYDFSKMQYFMREGHELNKAAYLDKMTELPNRNSFDTVFLMKGSDRNLSALGCVLMKIVNLPKINDEKGHEYGDQAIHSFSNILETIGESYGFVGRNGGNEFLSVIDECDADKAEDFISKMKAAIAEYNGNNLCPVRIEITYCYALNSELGAKSFTDLVTYTYKKSRRG